MKLELEDGTLFPDPDDPTIATALNSLNRQNGFAILSTSDLSYIQVAFNPDGGLVVEYQEGDIDRHFQSVSAVPHQQVIEAFRLYARSDPTWKQICSWEKISW